MEEKKTGTVNLWLITIGIIGIIIFIIPIIALNSTEETGNDNLSKKITIGKLTYFIDSTWESKSDSSKNLTYNYYYPSANTILMVMFQSGDEYGDSSTIDNFLDDFVSGIALSTDDFISKSTKKINNYNYGIVKYYIYSNNDKYEVISYVIPNKDECYVFSFGQKDKLNNKNIDTIENIVKKVDIITETEEEKKARLQKEAEEEKQKKEQQEHDFKNSCSKYTYKEIARNPDNYKGKNVKFTGEVIQVSEDFSDNSIAIRLNITKDEYGYYEDTIYCTYTYSNGENKILEDDIITIYGTCQGDTSYTSIFGSTITLPKVEIKYLTIHE